MTPSGPSTPVEVKVAKAEQASRAVLVTLPRPARDAFLRRGHLALDMVAARLGPVLAAGGVARVTRLPDFCLKGRTCRRQPFIMLASSHHPRNNRYRQPTQATHLAANIDNGRVSKRRVL